jgi:hypothetical protein
MSILYRGPSKDASYQVSIHLGFAKMNRNLVGSILGRSSVKIAHLVPIRLQIWLQQTILVSDWSISKNQAVSEKKIFLNRPIRNKKCLWQPCLLMDRDKMSSL